MGMTLQELDSELVARGFSAFDPDERYRYINWAYTHIAKEAQWSWERDTEQLVFDPGDFRKEIAATWASTQVVGVISPDQYRKKLPPADESQFLEEWYTSDLTSASRRGEPDEYMVWTEEGTNYLYVLPPVEATRTIVHVFSQKPVKLTQNSPNTITPSELDEAILLASLVRCHLRANEPDLAMNARSLLEEQFDLQLNLEEFGMEESIDRVEPYPWP